MFLVVSNSIYNDADDADADVYVCYVCAFARHCVPVEVGGQETTCRSWFLPFACEFRGLHSGGQAWQQVPLLTEPFLWPTLHIFNAIIINGFVL